MFIALGPALSGQVTAARDGRRTAWVHILTDLGARGNRRERGA
jgi:hypothetical protein